MTADLAEKSKWTGPIGTNDSIPSDSSLDECAHLARDADVDAYDIVVTRLSNESVPYLKSMTADLAKKSKSDDPIGTNDSVPSNSSLDEWVHLDREADEDALDIAARRASDESVGGASDNSRSSSDSSIESHVSFAGEEYGLEPRHVVTEIRYLPRTTDDEKRELFYTSQEMIGFRKEVLYERIKDKMHEIKNDPENATAHEEVRQLYLQVGRLCSK